MKESLRENNVGLMLARNVGKPNNILYSLAELMRGYE
jgi:hypothetical protein